MLVNQIRRIRNIGRISHIFNRAAAHGLGYFVERLGFTHRPTDGRTPAEARLPPLGRRVRMLLQDLGPTFIKLGQVASSRADLLPPDVVEELRELQDQVPADPSDRVLAVIDLEFDTPHSALFSEFDETPLAAASIAQVYAAKTLTGENVIVKVQRPALERIVSSDIDALRYLAELAEARFPVVRPYSPSAFVEEFAETITDELVFTREARNTEYMSDHYRGDPRVRFPKVHWDLTSHRVITLERIEGIRINDVEALVAAGHDPKRLASNVAALILEQVLTLGFAHGDPHGGNLLVTPDGRIAFIDFGIVCRLDPSLRESLVRLFSAIFAQDSEEVVDALATIGALPDEVNFDNFRREIHKLLARYYFLPRHEMGIGQLANKILTIMFKFGVRTPPDFAVLAKVLLLTEGTCLALDPAFDFNEAARPLARELRAGVLGRARPVSALRAWASFMRYSTGLPKQISRLLARAQRGSLSVQVESHSLHRGIEHVSDSLNRVALAFVTAGLAIASAFLIAADTGPFLWGKSAIGLLGLVLSGVLLLWVVVGLLIHRRARP